MYSLVLWKILYEPVYIQNFEEDNPECIMKDLFYKRFSIKEYISKILEMYSIVFRRFLYETIPFRNFEEDNRECIYLFSVRISIKQYISQILNKIIENVFNFPKDSLSCNTHKKF